MGDLYLETQMHREDDEKMEAEIGVRRLQTEEHQRLPDSNH